MYGGVIISDNVENKLYQYFVNGVTHNLILWIISKNTIHGYAIMKKLEEFFNFDNETNCDVKINSSKIYPILKRMEEKGLITSEWDVQNNKRVKFYSITQDGQETLNKLINNFNKVSRAPAWMEFFNDIWRDNDERN